MPNALPAFAQHTMTNVPVDCASCDVEPVSHFCLYKRPMLVSLLFAYLDYFSDKLITDVALAFTHSAERFFQYPFKPFVHVCVILVDNRA